MDLYLTGGFFRTFAYFLLGETGERTQEELRAFRSETGAFTEAFERDMRIERITDWISLMSQPGSILLRQPHFRGYLRLKTELPELTDADLLNLYAVLFSLEKANETSFPAREILVDRYPEIVLQIAKEAKAPVVFTDARDPELFEKAVYAVLCDVLPAFCTPDRLEVWGKHYDDGAEEPAEPVPGRAWEEYERVTCYIHVTDIETVNRMKQARYAAGYYSTDVDNGIMLIGNLITFTTGLMSNAVTLQITGRTSFGSYEEMFRTIGPGAFGYKDKTPEACAAETERFFARYSPEGPVALKVKRLAKPVFSAEDFIAQQGCGERKHTGSGPLTEGVL